MLKKKEQLRKKGNDVPPDYNKYTVAYPQTSQNFDGRFPTRFLN